MTRNEVYSDDGQKVRATQGRPPKPGMTETEFNAILPILTLPKGTHGSSLDRAALEICLMRGMHQAMDPRTRKARSVSGRWVSLQLQARGISGKNGMREKFGTAPKKHEVGKKSQIVHHSVTRINQTISSGEIARVQNQENGATAKDVEETKGPTSSGSVRA